MISKLIGWFIHPEPQSNTTDFSEVLASNLPPTAPAEFAQADFFNRPPDRQSDNKACVVGREWATWVNGDKVLSVWWLPDGSYTLHPWTVKEGPVVLTEKGLEPTDKEKKFWWDWLES